MRKRYKGTSERPRLVVHRTNRNIFAQLVNDADNTVITGCSTLSKALRDKNIKEPLDRSKEVGAMIARLSKEKGVETVLFDRKRYKYHGNVKALADGAREGGLKF